ncbi:acyltransferase family protein [Demequina lutea]|uniref:Peptidoglycan/LPS O-acetylase OafA/YrhL n=1 Tax=Demequina lutea TaxID=431489 RepID=A0A7Z0CJQ8_9MICO|nr:acyltransferase family protein [Demequina lutea]NYI40980.1 peptidoglycan/LPS O-acetylase OafA/YrhL [Demequina lutea]
MDAATETSPGDSVTTRARGRFRPDVEALRALAITLVLLFHAGVTFVPGGFVGVDVFFVISGFLITGLLVRELEGSGRIRLANFYARRVRRLIPAAVTVLAFVAVVTLRFSPGGYRDEYGSDISSAAGYWANWHFAARAVNYLGSQLAPSPVLHYWSLSVEEQFYVVWPVLLALVAVGVRRWSWRIRPAMAIALGAVAVPSFVWNVMETASNQPFAFFDTGARMWELSLGGLVAIGAPLWSKLPRRVRMVGTVVGLGAVAVSALAVHEAMPWPGTLALLPTVGTALIIVSGSAGTHAPVMTGALWRPLVWVGGMSYSLYLWHWPVLIAAREIWGPGTVARGLGAIGVAFVLAWLTHRFIENPVRFSPRLTASAWRSLAMGLGLSVCGVALGLVVTHLSPSLQATPGVGVDPTAAGAPATVDLTTVDPTAPLGAAVLWPDPVARWADIPKSGAVTPVPDPGVAINDRPIYNDPNCHLIIEFNEVTPRWCIAGDTQASRRIVVVGDSKAIQWYSALNAYGLKNGWRVEFTSKASCPFSEATLIVRSAPYTQCDEWNRLVLAGLDANPPDVVITSGIYGIASPLGSSADVPMSEAAGIDGYTLRWTHLESEGIHVIALLDNPQPPLDIDECVLHHLSDLDQCALNRSSAVGVSGGPSMREAAGRTPGVSVIDFTDYFCDATVCPAVIDNVVVYRGGYHLTDSYVRTLAPMLDWQLNQILGTTATATATP